MGKLNGTKRSEVLGKDAATGEDIVSAKAVLDATGPFGAVDTLDPGLRLRVFLDAAKTFRSQHPDAPKRAAELAAEEVFRLREALESARDQAKRAETYADAMRALNNTLGSKALAQGRSRWFRLGRWLGFYA